jgi:hypothetical protein
MFDKLLLISEGYPIYYGAARETMEYFSLLRFSPEIAMNPAEFLLDLATGQVNDISIPTDIFEDQEPTHDPSKSVIKVRIPSAHAHNRLGVPEFQPCLEQRFYLIFG